jgi:bla regulator protein blaR1
MIPESLSPVANHLWQSTLFAGAAGLSMLALRNNAARVRYWVWVAASLKFAVPFSLLIALGSHIPLRVASAPAQRYFAVALDGVSQPFAQPVARSNVPYPLHPPAIPLAEILIGIWACGFMGITASWLVRWRPYCQCSSGWIAREA